MRYRVNSPQVINETIDGEAIMINLATGAYYSLDRVGGDVWAVLEHGATAEDVVAALEARYDGNPDDMAAGVRTLLDQLVAEELVVATDEPGSAPPAPEPGATKATFTAPRLDKFTDMQDLILLDPVHEVDSRGWPHTAPAPGIAG
jgi:hypothetical protein